MRSRKLLLAALSTLAVSVGLIGLLGLTDNSDVVSTFKFTSNSNIGVAEISDLSNYSTVFASSDMHGMYDNGKTLLQAAGVLSADGHWAAGNALYIVVGDSIDKGSQSLEVLDLWIQLDAEAQQQGGKVSL